MANTLDKTGRLDDETMRVVDAVLNSLHPPTNPAVLLLAMRNWYLVHGSGAVLQAFTDWLVQLLHVEPFDFKPYREGKLIFAEKTGWFYEAEAAI